MAKRIPAGGGLGDYRAKRAAEGTPEPFGRAGAARPGLFVVQQHAARRLHYDFRLEVGGVLRSWAVPKGPSLDPSERRLAVATEDHPVEYGEFEGVIPTGNYGAGAVIVWDRGATVHHLDPEEGIARGKLLFELKGYKLRGLWTLVRTGKKTEPGKEWLLIKKPDAAATGESVEELGAASVLSGQTVADLLSGRDRAAGLRERLAELGARRRRLEPGRVSLMLAQLRRRPFSGSGWLFELKYDGYRLLAARGGAGGPERGPGARLLYRSGRDASALYPEIARALAALPYDALLLDGELVVLDEEARPSFARLQARAALRRALDVEHAAVRQPATFFAFDLLAFEGLDLRSLPLARRKEALREILPAAGPLRYADHVEERGEAFYAEVRRLGLEGVIAKRADSLYRGGRSSRWLKIRADRTGDFAVVGYTRPRGSRSAFGALHLAAAGPGGLLYAGRVGSGFAERDLAELRARLDRSRRRRPACEGAPEGPGHVWVDPELVAEVRFTEITAAGQLRHPVFVRLREDKRVEECVPDGAPPPEPAVSAGEPARARRVRPTRTEKVFWPEEGYTKGDLLAYYDAVAEWILPYLRDRPLVLDRYPDGIAGKSFFQKNAPGYLPSWVRTERLWSGDADDETRCFVCDDATTLRYLVNLAAIPLHVQASRLATLETPDWSILDLDAKQAAFTDVVRVARQVRRLCREIGLPCFAKTSGATGMHVLIPLGRRYTFEQSRQLAELLARVVAERAPEIASVARTPEARVGRVYIDFLQNGRGKLLVAPYSLRPLPGAPVSTPLRWREVTAKLDPARFDLRSVPARCRRQKSDPLSGVLGLEPDLPGALARLAGLLA